MARIHSTPGARRLCRTKAWPQANLPKCAMAESGGRGRPLFPLSFTPFEYYYLLEDRPEYASTFPVRLHCRGPLDRQAFSEAFRLSLMAPICFLTARITYDRRHWPNGSPVSRPRSIGPTFPRIHMPVEILRPCPRAWHDDLQTGDLTEWEFVFHHVAVDGLGAFQFIMDLFLAYAHLSTGADGPLPWRSHRHRLPRSGRASTLQEWRPADGPGAAAARDLAAQHPPRGHGQQLRHEPPRWARHRGRRSGASSDRERNRRAVDIAAVQSVMLHDLLLRDYFLTLAQWNQGTPEARRPSASWCRRTCGRREDYRMPAANVFSFCSCRGAWPTARIVSNCSNRSVRNGGNQTAEPGSGFEAGLRILHLAGAVALVAGRPWPFATAIFSIWGRGSTMFRCRLATVGGRLRRPGLRRGIGHRTIRPDTPLILDGHPYLRGALAVGVRCDPRWFSPQQRRGKCSYTYVEQLRITIDTET